MKRILTSFLALTLGTPALAGPAQVTLLPGWRMENGHHMAALSVTLDPGWKTYWRAPGDAGIPPMFDWSGSENLGEVIFHWPTPEPIDASGMLTIGYHDQLILPIEVVPQTQGESVTLTAQLLMGICEHICVPVEARVDATLPAHQTVPVDEISWALDSRPDTLDEAGARLTCEADELPDGMRVTAQIAMPALGEQEVVVFEISDPEVWVSEAVTLRSGDVMTSYADFVAPHGTPFAVAGDDLRLTVLGAGRAVDLQGCDIAE